jgi:hypothetical protein
MGGHLQMIFEHAAPARCFALAILHLDCAAIAKKTPHFVWAKDGEVIIQTTGMGPTGTK